jgi:hypothetical protein
MIKIKPQHPVLTSGDSDPTIGFFADSEWWNLVELARRYGFDPPNVEVHFPRPYDHPVEVNADVSQDLYEAISAVYKDEAVPYAATWEESNETSSTGIAQFPGEEPEEASIVREAPHEHPELHVGKVQVKRLMHCAQIGSERGGLVIWRTRDED